MRPAWRLAAVGSQGIKIAQSVAIAPASNPMTTSSTHFVRRTSGTLLDRYKPPGANREIELFHVSNDTRHG
jgi:hypothetical protein